MSDENGAKTADILDLEADAPDEPLDRTAYAIALIAARCPELSDADLAMISQLESLGETIPLAVADQILDVVMALDERMAKLEATVLAGNDLIGNVWTAMQDFTITEKQAMLSRLEVLVESEASTHHPLQ